jgi:hypothetical protein
MVGTHPVTSSEKQLICYNNLLFYANIKIVELLDYIGEYWFAL